MRRILTEKHTAAADKAYKMRLARAAERGREDQKITRLVNPVSVDPCPLSERQVIEPTPAPAPERAEPVKHRRLALDSVARLNSAFEGIPERRPYQSKGEHRIAEYLHQWQVRFEPQKTFSGLKDKSALRFDFWLPDYGLLIEYNGEQHYKPIGIFGGGQELKNIQRRDRLKAEYCKRERLALAVIRYDQPLKKTLRSLLNFDLSNF